MRMMVLVVVALLALPSLAHAGRRGGGSRGGSGHLTGTGSSSSSHVVRGYTTKRGTVVAPHRQTNADHTQRNNYGTKNNVNPSTGKTGTRYATH